METKWWGRRRIRSVLLGVHLTKLSLFSLKIIVSIAKLICDVTPRERVLFCEVAEHIDLILLGLWTIRLVQSSTRRTRCLLNVLPIVVRKLMLMVARWNVYAVRIILSVRRLRLKELRLLEQGSYRSLLWCRCDPHALSRGSGPTYRLSLTCGLAKLLHEVLVNFLLLSFGMLLLSNWFPSTCQHSRLAYIIDTIWSFRRVVTRTAVLMNELIVLALHCWVEALIGYLIIVNTARSDPTLRIATQMWWSLIPRPMTVYWVLVLLAHAGHLHVQVVRALSWGLWVWVGLVKNETILAEHVLVGQCWMEGRSIVCSILTTTILID